MVLKERSVHGWRTSVGFVQALREFRARKGQGVSAEVHDNGAAILARAENLKNFVANRRKQVIAKPIEQSTRDITAVENTEMTGWLEKLYAGLGCIPSFFILPPFRERTQFGMPLRYTFSRTYSSAKLLFAALLIGFGNVHTSVSFEDPQVFVGCINITGNE